MNIRPFSSVLIANRGEIAVRIIRAARERGLRTVAVHSEADADALHVRSADQAVCIGPAASASSYLVGDRVLQAAKDTGADAIHPGYGFLSENADFARQVIDAGLVWIGPPPDAISSMGSKTAARQRMHAAGVPVVPGTLEPIADPAEALSQATSIGYPLMLKAAAGGGGKGMRLVHTPQELPDALLAAQSEAQKSFGDPSVYIERAILQPKHIEIQVLADAHGNTVHLFERDCSVQRRHQKVIEEAPCSTIDPATRDAMAQAAVRAAAAVDYVGAGTCEFLLGADGEFFFLEMNTRLQVEHPITECITGIDLAAAQLRIAAGEKLWFTQEDLSVHGHAIECRIYAEDAREGFRPAPGPLHIYREPTGPWVRVDSGVVEGGEVPIHYDPMIAKLVVWGRDRTEAIQRTLRALEDYHIVGPATSIPFFRAVLRDPAFVAGDYTTGYIDDRVMGLLEPEPAVLDEVITSAAIAMLESELSRKPIASGSDTGSAWKRSAGWRRESW